MQCKLFCQKQPANYNIYKIISQKKSQNLSQMKVIQICVDITVSKLNPNCNVWMNYPLKCIFNKNSKGQ